MAYPEYPTWVREPALEMYRQGFSSHEIEALTGVGRTAILRWCQNVNISRSPSEAQKGELGPRWKGDDAGYNAQHTRARKDFPSPLGWCQACETFATCPHCGEVDYERVNEATVRARVDHTNFPYRKEYVLAMCISCNEKHSMSGGFVILFQEVT